MNVAHWEIINLSTLAVVATSPDKEAAKRMADRRTNGFPENLTDVRASFRGVKFAARPVWA